MSEKLPPTRTNDRLSWPLVLALIVWIAVAVAGWYGISAYGFTGDPQATTDIVPRWPTDSTIGRMSGRPTLVLFLHPKCPCSRATVAELERLPVLVPVEALPEICVIASAPREAGELWWSSSSMERSTRLPNVHLMRDSGGVETALFGARISGTVLLFDAAGNRLYAGGVTMARGHAGDNVGLRAIADLLQDHGAFVSAVPPLGCEMVRESRELEEASSRSDSQARAVRSVGGDPT